MLLAYVLALGVVGLPFIGGLERKGSAWSAAGLTLAQIVVAAVMVLQLLPQSWRAIHVALGAAVFSALVSHTYLVGREGSDRFE